MLAIDASALVEEALDAALRFGHAEGVVAGEGRILLACVRLGCAALVVKELKDKRHTDISAVCRLLKVCGSRVVVYLDRYLVNTGQGMHYRKVCLCGCELVGGEDLDVLKSFVLLLGGKSLLLNSRHIEDIELIHLTGEVGDLGVLALAVKVVALYVLGKL